MIYFTIIMQLLMKLYLLVISTSQFTPRVSGILAHFVFYREDMSHSCQS